MNVGSFDGFDRDESHIMEPAGVLKERSDLLLNMVEPFLIPIHSVHFGDHSDEFCDS